MKQLLKAVEQLARKELARARTIHGKKFNSHHEAYAVILEEFEEAKNELAKLNLDLDGYWLDVRRDIKDSDNISLKAIKRRATNLAAEAIQVVAMADKALEREISGERIEERDGEANDQGFGAAHMLA